MNTLDTSQQAVLQDRSAGRSCAHRPWIVLTPRGRAVLALVLASCAIFMWILFGSGTADASDSSSGPATSVVVVQPGENLWSIAQDVDPSGDPRDLVIRIREINALGSQHVYPGQSLIVPIS